MPFPVDPSYVKTTEAKLGVSFPLGFIARMVRLNGGEVEACGDVWELHSFLDTSDRKHLKRTCNDIVYETRWSREHAAGYPQDAVSIAGNGGGDELVFLPDRARPGRLQDAVYFWDHETGELTEVASDFHELAEPKGRRDDRSESRRRPTRS
jgi:hypothetical protein